MAIANLADPPGAVAHDQVRVLFFGRVADVCGRSIAVDLPRAGCSLEDLKGRIARVIDGGGDALGEPCLRVAIDQLMADADAWVSPGQEVAFLSAFSGG